MGSKIDRWLPKQDVLPKVLVVDDQSINIRVIYNIFKDDCDLFMAKDADQAIAQAHKVQPDIILLDVVLPGEDGYRVCSYLKANSETKDIPVIFITANITEADEEMGFKMGAVDFIRKPINAVITRARVRTHLLLKQQADALARIALTDALTNLPNRRAFEMGFELAWRQCAREHWSLAVIMIDVDFFKLYNDRFGHQAGDDCLQLVAKTLKGVLKRPADALARYGGEEFVCVLSNTDLDGAKHIAEQFRQAVQSLELPHPESDACKFVTVSQGVAAVVPVNVGDEAGRILLLSAADKRLYKAKEQGRNQVCG